MATYLITGTNRGLGLEFVKQYAAAGDTVLACARAPGNAEALSAIAKQYPALVRLVALDVADHASIDQAATALSGTAIDVLINNAGVYGPAQQTVDEMDFDGWARTLAVNTMAPYKMVQAFRPHLMAGVAKKAVTVTSYMGSIADAKSGFYAYRSSKAAVNMVMHLMGNDLKPDGITTAVLHPGWVQTDMGGPQAPLRPPESVSGMRKVIADLTPAQTGSFIQYDGKPLPW